ncbi:apolipoprotein N-acyltransferase [Fulvimarina sp. 2208YS6-2-32]|uniref:Apolipoprotein N-acyltransferase n=1 Tax=Fulvimarina uroteuthidis TaxID=3098149 RepID=A0ABU5HYG6_9HYPH|nr:apolipoprotein N-acyltransferase [Fulvimarina sp. 2208YS6-2-32]MDY8107845.1 apolipoprotein N-acyltransferase [Fulvimarina sp. 2208YS6-2-32]
MARGELIRSRSLFDRIAGRVVLAAGWRRALLAVLSGAFATLALAPVDFPFAGFVAFPVLVWLIDGTGVDVEAGALRRSLRPFWTGWLFGFGYFVAGLWWLGAALLVDAGTFVWFLPLAVLGLPAVLAIFFGFAVALCRLVWSDSAWRILGLAACLGLAEWLRSWIFTGFPWNEIGVMAASHPVLMQVVSLVGVHGLTILAVIVFSVPAILLDNRGRWPMLGLATVLLVGQIGYGLWRLQDNPTFFDQTVVIQIVQPNIEQSLKWDPEIAGQNFDTLIEMTTSKEASPGSPGGRAEGKASAPRRLIVWPETAVPFVLTDRPEAISRLAQSLSEGETLIAGAARVDRSEAGRQRVYNTVYVIDDEGTIKAASDKVHLVPFGEYLPFQDFLESLGVSSLVDMPGGFSAGPALEPVPLDGAPAFLPLICYEIIFPREVPVGDPVPGFILNVTNDAWYGATPGPYQHVRMATVTAVALGLPMVRSANTGISVVTDAVGREIGGLGLNRQGNLVSALPANAMVTPYRTYRDLPFLLLLLTVSVIALVMRFALRPGIG